MAPYTRIIWVHDMSPEKKTLKLKTGALRKPTREKISSLLRRLYNVDSSKYVPSTLRYVCLNEDPCIIYGSKLDIGDLTVLYEDSWIALYTKKRFVPSISIVQSIYSDHGIKSAIIVKEQGVKAFLYGNDILPDSVIDTIPPIGELITVIDSTDGEIVGFVTWNPRRRIYENIFDIGLFLRKLG